MANGEASEPPHKRAPSGRTSKLVPSVTAEGRGRRSPLSVLLIDDADAFATSFGRLLSAQALAVCRACSFAEARAALRGQEHAYIVSELRVHGESLFDFLSTIVSLSSLDRLFVVTIYPSIATAVRLVRMGVAGYFTKPVSSQAINEMFGGDALAADAKTEEAIRWPTLDRTIWEYLCQVRQEAGSVASAARRLGLDRRSLRRMLAKYPPPL